MKNIFKTIVFLSSFLGVAHAGQFDKYIGKYKLISGEQECAKVVYASTEKGTIHKDHHLSISISPNYGEYGLSFYEKDFNKGEGQSYSNRDPHGKVFKSVYSETIYKNKTLENIIRTVNFEPNSGTKIRELIEHFVVELNKDGFEVLKDLESGTYVCSYKRSN